MTLQVSTAFFFVAYSAINGVYAMDRVKCNAEIVEQLHNHSLAYNDSIFFWDGHKHMSDPTNIGLTLEGCKQRCGAKMDWYPDIGPRLTTWLIPVVVLIGNMQFALLGKPNTFWTIMHLIGDPFDSIWSLLTKLESWNRSYDLAEKLSSTGGRNQNDIKDRGTILAVIHELLGPGSNPEQIYQDIIDQSTIDGDDPTRPALHHLCREIANELSDSTGNELPRTWLAVLSYVFTVLGAFVDAIGGKSSSQPGGRIGTAMFISWLLPTVLLSNTIGGFTSRRTSLRTMERFIKATKPAVQIDARRGLASPRRSSRASSGGDTDARCGSVLSSTLSPGRDPMSGLRQPFLPVESVSAPLLTHNCSRSVSEHSTTKPGLRIEIEDSSPRPVSRPHPSVEHLDLRVFSQDRNSVLFGRQGSATGFGDAQPWYGAIYTYLPEKRLFNVLGMQSREHGRLLLFFLSIFPVLVALVTSFLIIWVTPTTGLTCRHFPLIGIFAFWILSTMITTVTWQFMTGKYHWRVTIIKDTLIAIPALFMIFLSSSGLFNSCWCWSGIYSRGLAKAVVLLDPDPTREHLAETVYPVLVGACLGLQMILFLGMLGLSRRGRSLLRRDEDTKQRDFWVLHMGLEAPAMFQRESGKKAGFFEMMTRRKS